MAHPLIHLDNVCKSFDGKQVIKNVSLDVYEGEVLAVIGTSGCGKSTLLKLIAGLLDPDSGTIELADPNFTLVFQYSALFDSLTVFENVAFSLLEPPDDKVKAQPFKRLSDAEIKQRVAEKLRLVGLEGIEDRYPGELSGGMQKRVSFARAIMSQPKIVLYDEPTAGLDPVASHSLEDYINKVSQELQAASIVVTHTLSTICRTADKVILLNEGEVQWQGKPFDLFETNDPVVMKFARAATDVTR